MTTLNMKKQLVEVPLGEAGLDYVRSALQGDTTFSREVLRAGFSDGCASALVPVGTALPRALAFDQGGFVSASAAENWLVQHVVSLCRSIPDSVVLFEDKWGGRKGEDAVMAGNETKFFHDQFVNYFVEGRKANNTSVAEALGTPASFLLLGAFIRYPLTEAQLPADLTVDDSVLHELAANTVELYVSAYDRESYVIWRK
jgi:hypothetical protein